MSATTCPHCQALNPTGGNFCEACGKALPRGGGPRVVGAGQIASTGTGQALQGEELQKQMKSARGGLIAVAILQFIGAVAFYFIFQGLKNDPNYVVDDTMATVIPIVMVIIGFIYIGLWFWAKTSPFPAAIVGLVLFCTLWLADILADPSGAYRGILIKIIIVAVLIKAVKAGMEYRKLLESAGRRA